MAPKKKAPLPLPQQQSLLSFFSKKPSDTKKLDCNDERNPRTPQKISSCGSKRIAADPVEVVRFERVLCDGVVLQVRTQPAADLEVDALVCPTSPNLSHDGEVCKSIISIGGKKVKDPCMRRLNEKGGLPEGDILVTPGGGLPASYVIHAAGKSFDGFVRAFGNALCEAARLKLSSIAIPANSCGTGVLSEAKQVKCILTAITKHSDVLVKRIHIIVTPTNAPSLVDALKSSPLLSTLTESKRARTNDDDDAESTLRGKKRAKTDVLPLSQGIYEEVSKDSKEDSIGTPATPVVPLSQGVDVVIDRSLVVEETQPEFWKPMSHNRAQKRSDSVSNACDDPAQEDDVMSIPETQKTRCSEHIVDTSQSCAATQPDGEGDKDDDSDVSVEGDCVDDARDCADDSKPSSQEKKQADSGSQRENSPIRPKPSGVSAGVKKSATWAPGMFRQAETNNRRRKGCETKAEHLTQGSHKLIVRQGDLLEDDVDVIVNAANSRLNHAGGLAGCISRRGGREIQEESDRYIQEHGRVPTGDVAVTGAGNLDYRFIIHAVGPVYHREAHPRQMLRRVVRRTLEKARREFVPRVALPAISSGIFGYPKPLCAKDMLDATIEWCDEWMDSPVRDIHFTNIDDETVGCFVDAFRERFGVLYS